MRQDAGGCPWQGRSTTGRNGRWPCCGPAGPGRWSIPAARSSRIWAEPLVHVYASCDREASYGTLASGHPVFRDRFTGETYAPTLGQRQDFAELTAANELDLAVVDDEFRTDWGGQLLMFFDRFAPLLSDAARKDLRAGLDPDTPW
ncbi:hypothetical protein [Streptomyces sp. NPDC059909]|uniref:hypothetical protein n=1 Tax=Streptomyces sp. NPDC059909 TaxID=3346998 RepID=UPI003665F0D0